MLHTADTKLAFLCRQGLEHSKLRCSSLQPIKAFQYFIDDAGLRGSGAFLAKIQQGEVGTALARAD